MKFERFKVTLSLTVEQVNQLAGLTALENAFQAQRGVESDYREIDVLSAVVDDLVHDFLMEYLEERKQVFLSATDEPQSERDGEAGDVPTRNPSPEEAEQEPETVSNAEELPHVETLVPFGEPEDEPETMIPIIDADGVRRMATLDEVEEMREAAQGIYAGEPPEPKEPETDSNAEELPAVRRGPLVDDRTDIYIYYLEHGELPPGYSPDDFSNDRETDSPALLRDVLFADALFEALSA